MNQITDDTCCGHSWAGEDVFLYIMRRTFWECDVGLADVLWEIHNPQEELLVWFGAEHELRL